MRCPHCDGSGQLSDVQLGDLVLKHRTEKGLTQAELAARSGLGRSQIANIETNRTDVPTKTLRRIADALGVSSRQLLPDSEAA